MIESVRTGKPRFGNGIIRTPADVGGWPECVPAPRPPTSTTTGCRTPGKEHRLNPADAGDGNRDADGDGYPNVEEWLNGTDPRQFARLPQAGEQPEPLP